MAFEVTIGISEQMQDSFGAGNEAANDLQKKIGEKTPSIMIVLASSIFDQQEMLKGIRHILPNIPLVGCTTAGAIVDQRIIEHGIVVIALCSDTISFYPIKVENISAGMLGAGKNFGEQAQTHAHNKPSMALIFSDALSGNGTELVRGVLGVLGGNFPIIGGAAADDMNFKKTYQYYNDEVLTNAVVGCVLEGAVRFAVGADHGWQPIGDTMLVTKAKGTTLYELDHKPAFSIYQDYFGARAKDFKETLSLAAVSYPLGMAIQGTPGYMIRVPLSVQDDGSIVCGAEVLEGSSVSLMLGTVNSAIEAAQETTKRLGLTTSDIKPRIIFLSNCVARKILYGDRIVEELTAIKKMAGEEAHIVGFYSYGQIAPLREKVTDVAVCDPGFYEQSIAIAILGE